MRRVNGRIGDGKAVHVITYHSTITNTGYPLCRPRKREEIRRDRGVVTCRTCLALLKSGRPLKVRTDPSRIKGMKSRRIRGHADLVYGETR